MEQVKQVAYGFAAMASGISLFVTFLWIGSAYLNPLLGVPLFLLLMVPFALYCRGLVKRVSQKTPIETRVKQAKNVLMALPGVGLACWFFDVLSTFFVINISQSGTELNPLGWPYSAPAALVYYIPITLIMYYMLFRVKRKVSFHAALIISLATLSFSTASFFASLNNFGLGVSRGSATAYLVIICIWSAVIISLSVFNIASVRAKRALSRNLD